MVYGFEVGVELNTHGDFKDQGLLCGWLERLEIQHVLVDFYQKHTSFVKKIRSKIGSKTSKNLDSKDSAIVYDLGFLSEVAKSTAG